MKLKGDLELNAEELYGLIEEEIYNIALECRTEIINIKTDNNINWVHQFIDKTSELQLYYSIASVLYMADFDLSEINIMLDIYSKANLLKILYRFIKKYEKSININDNKQIEQNIKLSLSLVSICNEEVKLNENK